jgi:excisionase family DNA binding protein
MINNTKTTIIPDQITRLLRPDEVAESLQISVSLAYKLIRRGDLPAVHIGKSVRVKPDDLQWFIDEHKLMNW